MEPILPVNQPVTIDIMLNFDGDGHGDGDGVGMCKQNFTSVSDLTLTFPVMLAGMPSVSVLILMSL